MAGKHGHLSGRRSALAQLRFGQIVLALLEAAIRLFSGDWDSSSSSLGYSPDRSSLPSRSRLRVSWRRSMKLAVSELMADQLESDAWSEHRVGLIISGAKARRYLAVQPSESSGWDVQISRTCSSRGISDAYQGTPDTRLRTLLTEWDVRWLPTGICRCSYPAVLPKRNGKRGRPVAAHPAKSARGKCRHGFPS